MKARRKRYRSSVGPVLSAMSGMDARERHDFARGCGGKVRYHTLAKARKAIRSLAGRMGGGLHAYQCRYCGLWHLTSQARVQAGSD